jgi:glycerol kinase
LHNAIVWQDTRVDHLLAEYIAEGGQNRFRAQTGLPLASYFSALKLRWLLDHVPDARQKADSGEAIFGTIDSWLAWNFTGLHITDVTNASRTQLMNLNTCAWDDTLLASFHIPAPACRKSAPPPQHYGEIRQSPLTGYKTRRHARRPARRAGRPDLLRARRGQEHLRHRQLPADEYRHRAGYLQCRPAHHARLPARRAKAALRAGRRIAITGALVQWLRDNLGLFTDAAEIEPLARSVADNGDVYIVPAFSGLYAPYWREDARGVIAGLTRYANKAHIARAALEATAYQVRDVVEAMQNDSGIALRELKSDGGMVGNEILMQFQADILNAPVIRPQVSETTALGAAYAAGLACRLLA